MASSLRARVNFQRTPSIALDKVRIHDSRRFELWFAKTTKPLTGDLTRTEWSEFESGGGFYRSTQHSAPRYIELCVPQKYVAVVTLQEGRFGVYEESIFEMLQRLSTHELRPDVAEILVQKLAAYEAAEAGGADAIKEHALKRTELADQRSEIDFIFGCVAHQLSAENARLIDNAFARAQVQSGAFGSDGLVAVENERAALL